MSISNPANISVLKGSAFSLEGKDGTKFEKEHGGLLGLKLDQTGSLHAIVKAKKSDGALKRQTVVDIREATNFSVNGKKIKLDVPKGADSARFVIDLCMTKGGLDMQVKMDYMDGDKAKRVMYQDVHFDKGDTTKNLKIDQAQPIKDAPDGYPLDTEGYCEYKANKNDGNGPVANRGVLIKSVTEGDKTEQVSQETGVYALRATESAKGLLAQYKSDPESVATEIETLKNTLIDHLDQCKSWADVVDVTNAVATLHGKPNYTKDVDIYAQMLLKEEFHPILEAAGLDPKAFKEEIELAARLAVLGEAKNPMEVMHYDGKLKDDRPDDFNKYIKTIGQNTSSIVETKLSHLPKHAEILDVLTHKGNPLNKDATSILRSISAMDQPRKWRTAPKFREQGCDETGKYPPKALIKQLLEEAQERKYDDKVTQAFINIFQKLKNIEPDVIVEDDAGDDSSVDTTDSLSVEIAPATAAKKASEVVATGFIELGEGEAQSKEEDAATTASF